MRVNSVFIDIHVLTFVCESLLTILPRKTQNSFFYRPVNVIDFSDARWLESAVVKSREHLRSSSLNKRSKVILISQTVQNVEIRVQASYLDDAVSDSHCSSLII